MNSRKLFASGILSSIASSYESLAPSWVVTELSFINGVNVLFACATACQWQQQVLGKAAVKINESGAQLMENLTWVLADQQEIIQKALTCFFQSQTMFFFLETWNRQSIDLVLRERGTTCIATSHQVSCRNLKLSGLESSKWIQSCWK